MNEEGLVNVESLGKLLTEMDELTDSSDFTTIIPEFIESFGLSKCYYWVETAKKYTTINPNAGKTFLQIACKLNDENKIELLNNYLESIVTENKGKKDLIDRQLSQLTDEEIIKKLKGARKNNYCELLVTLTPYNIIPTLFAKAIKLKNMTIESGILSAFNRIEL